MRKEDAMHKYVIEREIPGAGKLSAGDLQGISQKSCGVLQELGPQIQWVESYVTDDKVYCVYIAATRSWFVNTQSAVAFLQIGSHRCKPSLIQQLLGNEIGQSGVHAGLADSS